MTLSYRYVSKFVLCFSRYGPLKVIWFTRHDHAPFRDGLSSKSWYLLQSTCLPNLKSLTPPTTKIWNAIQNVEIDVVCGS